MIKILARTCCVWILHWPPVPPPSWRIATHRLSFLASELVAERQTTGWGSVEIWWRSNEKSRLIEIGWVEGIYLFIFLKVQSLDSGLCCVAQRHWCDRQGFLFLWQFEGQNPRCHNHSAHSPSAKTESPVPDGCLSIVVYWNEESVLFQEVIFPWLSQWNPIQFHSLPYHRRNPYYHIDVGCYHLIG